jgi:hypothetical protein
MLEIVLIVLASIIALALLGHVLVRSGRTFWKLRGERIVTCPETGKPVGVDVDAVHAAATASLAGPADVRLKDCTRWPERETCGQECLAQIEAAPDECLVRNILKKWYAGARCVLCGAEIPEIRWTDHRPGFLSVGATPLAWADVASEDLMGVLATHRPICFNCTVAESFRLEHKDLVVEDPRPASRVAR